MIFKAAQLLRERPGATRSYDLEPEFPVHRGHVELLRVPKGVLVTADIDVILEAECSRCLVAFGYPARLHIEEVFYQQVDVDTGMRIESGAQPGDFLIGLDHTIDITEAVRQYSVMAAAMQPLCRPDCPGLCPECGQDLSMGDCGCDRTHLDPRWSVLAALKQRLDG
ncbi:MAG: DUF177 domain-containing protein [Chloroflexota bacterium]|nr:DUF177 domain-containing protein [Dehalococcoidia bacterium]MDW8046223.1 DUF177 domain-containing protein [Chloroflexota bacterium]